MRRATLLVPPLLLLVLGAGALLLRPDPPGDPGRGLTAPNSFTGPGDEDLRFVPSPPAKEERVPASGDLSGRVLDAGNGEPVPRARIEVAGRRERVVSADDGTFRLEGVPGGRAVVRVFPVEHVPAEIEVPVGGREGPPFDVFVRSGAVLEGRVLSSGAPVPGALVEAEGGAKACTADGDGRYELRGFAAGRHEVRVAAAGPLESLHAVEVEPGEGRRRQDLEIPLPWTATGHVVGPDGRPVEGARVALRPATLFGERGRASWFGGGPGETALSGPDGSFVLRDVADPGEEWHTWSMEPPGPRIWALREGLGLGASERLGGFFGAWWWPDDPGEAPSLAPGRTMAGIVVRIPGTVEVRLSLRGPGGGALPGQEVLLATTELGTAARYDLAVPPMAVRTGGEGRCTLRLQPGRWNVRASVPGHRGLDTWMDLPAQEAAAEWDFTLERGGTLSGRVTDPEGRPIEGAEVALLRGDRPALTARTGPDGRFSLEGAPDLPEQPSWGSVLNEVVVAKAGFREFRRRNEPVAPMEKDVVLHPLPPGSLRGRLLLPDGRSPARVGEVRLVREDRPGPPAPPIPVNDAEGRFRAEGLEAGTWAVEGSSGDLLGRTGGVAVGAGEAGEVRVVLGPAGSLSGIVVDGRGSPIRSAYVQLLGTREGGVLRSGWTDEGGRFGFQVIRAGRYGFAISGDGASYHFTETGPVFEVKAGAETRVTLPVCQGGTIRVEAVDGEGNPLGGVAVEAVDEAGHPAPMDVLGNRSPEIPGELRGVRPGTYRLRFTKEGHAPAEAPCTVSEGAVTPLRVVLR